MQRMKSLRYATLAAILALTIFALAKPVTARADVAATDYNEMFVDYYYFDLNKNARLTTATVSSSQFAYKETTSNYLDHPEYGTCLAYESNAKNGAQRGATIRALYKNAGTIRRQGVTREGGDIPCDLEITWVVRDAPNEGISKIGIANDLAYGFRTTNFVPTMRIRFLRAGTSSPVAIDGDMFFTMGSLNPTEGFTVLGATDGYVSNDAPAAPGQHGLPSDAIRGSYLKEVGDVDDDDNGWSGFVGVSVDKDYESVDKTVGDSKTIGGVRYAHTFWWRTGTVRIDMNNRTQLDVNVLTGSSIWGIPSFTPLTAGLPAPPTKSASTTAALHSDTITYTVRQPVNKRGSNIADGVYYSALMLKDVIPNGMRYVANSFKVLNTNGSDVTATAGTLTVQGQTLIYTFKKSFLNNTLVYNGGNLTFSYQTTIPHAANEPRTFANTAVTRFNNNPEYDQKTNTVTVKLNTGHVTTRKVTGI